MTSERALAVRSRFAELERRRIGREWTTAEFHSGVEHELADCLWSVLVLADRLDVDLAAAFDRTMDDLTVFLDEA